MNNSTAQKRADNPPEILKHKAKRKRFFAASALNHLEEITGGRLPDDGECWKLMSDHHFSMMSLILFVASHTVINRLHVSTFGIGKKELVLLAGLKQQGKLGEVSFVVGRIIDNSKSAFGEALRRFFYSICQNNGWRHTCLDNHAKLVIADTADGKYVIEGSSNLNDNPCSEQFSFERSAELYDFYEQWFMKWFTEERQ